MINADKIHVKIIPFYRKIFKSKAQPCDKQYPLGSNLSFCQEPFKSLVPLQIMLHNPGSTLMIIKPAPTVNTDIKHLSLWKHLKKSLINPHSSQNNTAQTTRQNPQLKKISQLNGSSSCFRFGVSGSVLTNRSAKLEGGRSWEKPGVFGLWQ